MPDLETLDLILVPNEVTIVVVATRTKPKSTAYSAIVAASSSSKNVLIEFMIYPFLYFSFLLKKLIGKFLKIFLG